MATSNAATTYMEHALLQFLFKNNTESFATPGNSIYVGLATAVSSIETGSLTEATFGSYARQAGSGFRLDSPRSGNGCSKRQQTRPILSSQLPPAQTTRSHMPSL